MMELLKLVLFIVLFPLGIEKTGVPSRANLKYRIR